MKKSLFEQNGESQLNNSKQKNQTDWFTRTNYKTGQETTLNE